MDIQFDYQELIDELKEEIGFGILTNTTMIQIIRSEDLNKDGYSEILDWYYNNKTMNLELAPEKEDSKEDTEDKRLIRDQYLQDKDKLEGISVEVCLAEMFSKTTTKPKKSKNNKNNNPFY
jgi:hypothetical protein